MSSILLEARPYRPFKSSEEYLEAMKEDLAEWLNTMYPVLEIHADNFMDRLDTGIALCKHANNVRQAAEDYLARRQARNKSMTRSMTSGLAGPILTMGNVHYLPAAKSGTFFARDNVSNFITWCRKSLKIFECLLFETDDLIMRKNEKHVILCLLEVARRGAKFGMLAPMLVQMERQIDREIAADNKANGIGCGTQTDNNCETGGTNSVATETELFDSDTDEEDDNSPMLVYGPQPQIITNDLKSLDEMVRDLVEKCTCPSQFPMVRVSEGKYRIGDTKVLIFVRILRSHVMVRVGGGWDTLSHYLDKHDPCRCKSQHRSSVAARLIPRANNQTNGIELHKAQVIFERSPPTARKIIPPQTLGANVSPTNGINGNNNTLRSPSVSALKPRSRSPTPQRKYLNQLNNASDNNYANDKQHIGIGSPNLARRSMSPSPRRLTDIRKKQTSLDSTGGSPLIVNSGGNNKTNSTSTEITNLTNNSSGNHVQFDNLNLINTSNESNTKLEIVTPPNGTVTNEGNKFENISDNGSEISDEGYRSLGVIQSNAQKRESLHSQTSLDDAENNARHDQTSSDSQLSPSDEPTGGSNKTPENLDITNSTDTDVLDTSLEPIPAATTDLITTDNKFEQSGVFISEDDITVNIANSTGLRQTGFSTKIYGGNNDVSLSTEKSTPKTKTVRSPAALRRRSVDDCRGSQNSLNDVNSRTGLPVFNRKQPVYRSVRTPPAKETNISKNKPMGRDITNTWNGRSPCAATTAKKRPQINSETFSPASGNFERNSKTRSSQILYDSNGRRVKGATSLTTSPIKNNQASPLAQQLLEAASNAKNDAQILEKMKQLFSRYSTLTNKNGKATIKKAAPVCDDFTRAWVHSNGNLERASSCSPPSKGPSKRSSAASSTDSTHSRDMSGIVLPRKNRVNSKIPCAIRQKTELY